MPPFRGARLQLKPHRIGNAPCPAAYAAYSIHAHIRHISSLPSVQRIGWTAPAMRFFLRSGKRTLPPLSASNKKPGPAAFRKGRTRRGPSSGRPCINPTGKGLCAYAMRRVPRRAINQAYSTSCRAS